MPPRPAREPLPPPEPNVLGLALRWLPFVGKPAPNGIADDGLGDGFDGWFEDERSDGGERLHGGVLDRWGVYFSFGCIGIALAAVASRVYWCALMLPLVRQLGPFEAIGASFSAAALSLIHI